MTTAGPNLEVLGQYGVLGLFAILLIAFAFEAIKRERERTDRAEEQVVEGNKALREYAIAVTSAIDAIKDLSETHRDLILLLQEVRRALDRLDRG